MQGEIGPAGPEGAKATEVDEKILDKKIIGKVAQAFDDLNLNATLRKISGARGIGYLGVSTGGLKSSPPKGSKKVKNVYVTPEGKFWVDYEDMPV